jgi:hypothetical protein
MTVKHLTPNIVPKNLIYRESSGYKYLAFWDLMLLLELSFNEDLKTTIIFSIYDLIIEPCNQLKAPNAELSLNPKNPNFDLHTNSRTFHIEDAVPTIVGYIDCFGEIEVELECTSENKIGFGGKDHVHDYLQDIQAIMDRIYWEASEINGQIIEEQGLTKEDNPYKPIKGWEDYSQKSEHVIFGD